MGNQKIPVTINPIKLLRVKGNIRLRIIKTIQPISNKAIVK